MTAKDLLLDNKDLTAHWRTVVHDRNTARVLSLVWAEWIHSASPTQEEVAGAKAFERVLLQIAEDEPKLEDAPNIGLNHAIDDPSADRITANETEKKQ